MRMLSAFITGLAGTELSPREAALLREARPCGVILFARNVESPGQVRRLTDAVKAAIAADDMLVLIDQEGGRVQRLKPPHWRTLPPAAAYGRVYRDDPDAALRSAGLAARLTAADLAALGINTDCAPVLDVPVAGSHDIIGDRAYGAGPKQVAALGRAVAEGFMAGGVLPVIKHIPGHGRATKDSHHDLPVVTAARADLENSDFAAFRALADMPAAMTAHVVFTAVDADQPASTSARVTADIIRGAIGFDGLLMSDDLGMRALTGTIAERASAVLAAGSDVALLCSGDGAETASVAAVTPPLQEAAAARFARACAVFRQQEAFDVAEAEASLAQLLRGIA
jgi:beta-N-acetylhexosaminidase